MIGQRFTRLTVVSEAPQKHGRRWFCLCDCGGEKIAHQSNLKRGLTRSCGCLRRETTVARTTTHGHSRKRNWNPTYSSWAAMVDRCRSEDRDNSPHYRDRGIKVCERWHRFENFLADMGERPDGRTLDRIDVDGNYEPDNCRWATRSEQMRNKRTNLIVEYQGRQMCLAEAAELSGVPYSRAQARLARGWSYDRAFSS